MKELQDMDVDAAAALDQSSNQKNAGMHMDDGPTEESGSRAEWDLAVCDKPLSKDLAAPHKIQQCTTCRMGTSCRNKAHRMVWWRKARITMHPEREKE
jgi:hypothetical protein